MASELALHLDEATFYNFKNALDKLSEIDRNKVVRAGLKKAISVVKGAEKKELKEHVKTGNLISSLNTKLETRKQRIWLGFSRPKGNHAHLIHTTGTAERFTRKGQYRGSIQKKNPHHGFPFAIDAFKNEGDEALSILMKTIQEEIERIAGR